MKFNIRTERPSKMVDVWLEAEGDSVFFVYLDPVSGPRKVMEFNESGYMRYCLPVTAPFKLSGDCIRNRCDYLN